MGPSVPLLSETFAPATIKKKHHQIIQQEKFEKKKPCNQETPKFDLGILVGRQMLEHEVDGEGESDDYEGSSDQDCPYGR